MRKAKMRIKGDLCGGKGKKTKITMRWHMKDKYEEGEGDYIIIVLEKKVKRNGSKDEKKIIYGEDKRQERFKTRKKIGKAKEKKAK